MRSFISNIILFLLIALFVYAGVSKLADRQHFAAVLSKMPLIKSVAPVVSFLLPSDELLIALLLFFPKTRIYGFWASLVIMFLFTGYIGYMIIFSPHLPCNCGGVLQKMNWREHFAFNLFFIFISIMGICSLPPGKNIVATHRQPDQLPQGKS